MKRKHPYSHNCLCDRCVKEFGRRARQSAREDAQANRAIMRGRARAERYAPRSEQYARYIDCGPGGWDDQ